MDELNYTNFNQLCFTIDEACKATGIGRTKLYEALDSGVLPAKKWGKRTLILKSDLEIYLSNLAAYKTDKAVHNG